MIRKRLRSVLGEDRHQQSSYELWAVITGVCEALAVATIIPIVSGLFSGRDDLWGWVLAALALTAVYCVAYYTQSAQSFRVATTVLDRLQGRIGDHVVSLPMGWFRSGTSSKLSIVTTKGVVDVASAAAHYISPVFIGVSSAITVTIIALIVNWQLGVALIIVGPMIAVLTFVGTRIADTADERVHARDKELNNRLLEFARCQPVLRAAGQADTYAPLEQAQRAYTKESSRLLWRQAFGLVLGLSSVQAASALIVGLGAYLALNGSLDPSSAVALIAFCLRFTGPLATAIDLLTAIRMSTHSLARIDQVLAEPPLSQPATPVAPSGATDVAFDAVSFGYDDEPVLQNVSAHLPAGTLTALVGPSGSGKTTMVKLIARFHDVDQGGVRIGGVDVRNLTTEDLMGQLALVFQDVYLFNDTLLANIRIGRPDATDEEVRHAAELAGVHEIVERLPDGWQARVGEAGTALSGGERQRVSIARALLKQAPVVLLDEATAALDPENERHVVASLEQLSEQATMLVVAHKLSTVVNADQILVLSAEGRIVDSGAHDTLLGRCAQYQTFWEERSAAVGWQLPSGDAAPNGTGG